MAEHGGWFRMYERVLNDPKVHNVSETDRWRWVECLCIAAMYGDETGRLRSLNDMAFLTRRSENDVETTMERLVNAGLIDRRNGGKTGFYWVVHDWEKWQQPTVSKRKPVEPADRPPAPAHPRETDKTDKTRQDDIERVSARDENPPPQNDVVDLAFERFKKSYPKRDGDQGWKVAQDKFRLAVKKGADPETIIKAADRYRETMRREGNIGERSKFVKHAATWMNQRMWEEHAPPVAKSSTTNGVWHPPENFDDSHGAWANRIRTARDWDAGQGAWSREKWGPAPGEPGCLIPADLLTENDLSRKWRVWEEVAEKMRQSREMIRELNG